MAIWYGLPALALAAVAAYVLGATFGHANPPVVAVQGASMHPTLQAGDLVVLTGADPARLRTGDIVAVTVPKNDRDQYGLPSHVVHRIVRIERTASGPIFVTKGDANSGRDVFQSRPGDIVGKLEVDVPGLGYPLLFLRSRQGEVFLAVAVLVALGYFLLGQLDERRAVENAHRDDLRQDVDRLVHAIGEYGEHLRSHTAVIENLAATTAELSAAASALRAAVEDVHESRAGNGGPPPAKDALADALRRRLRRS